MVHIPNTNADAIPYAMVGADGTLGSVVGASGLPGVSGLVLVNADGTAPFAGPLYPDAALVGNLTFRDTATLPGGTLGHLFTVAGGRVLITQLVGQVTTVIQSQATTIKITSTPTVGTAVDLCTTVDINALEVGGFVALTDAVGSAMTKNNGGLGVGMQPSATIVGPGTLDLTTGATSTGSIKWFVSYIALDAGATITPNGSTGTVVQLTADQNLSLLKKKFGVHTVRATNTLPASGAGNIFYVSGGRVALYHIFGEVTTVIQSQATTLKFTSTPITGTAVDICATVDVNALEVGGFVANNGVAQSGALVKALAGGISLLAPSYLIVPQGAISQVTVATSTGSMEYHAFWSPIDTGALLTVA